MRTGTDGSGGGTRARLQEGKLPQHQQGGEGILAQQAEDLPGPHGRYMTALSQRTAATGSPTQAPRQPTKARPRHRHRRHTRSARDDEGLDELPKNNVIPER
eukprot:9724534-Heterocapsa_arctica.AAC.1